MRITLLNCMMLTALLLSACTSVNMKDNTVKKRYTQFGVAKLSEAWQKESFRGTDLFFQHKKSDATIYVRSQCEKFSDSPLEALTSQMLVGMGKYDIISQNRQMVGDREALLTEVNVNLDGVPRYLKIMVLRKNRCVFDAVLSARQGSPEVIKDFDDAVMSFWAEADL